MAIISCRALLFDLDGVLVDSTECVTRTWRRWAATHGLDADHILAVAHGRRTIDTVRLVAPHLAVNGEVEALARSEARDTEGVYEVPGARDLVQALPEGTWAVITAGLRAVAMLRITHTELPEPAVLITAEDLAHGKPDPEGYLRAAECLEVPPAECVVIEDAPAGLAAARAAGMRAIAVTTTHAAESLAGAEWGVATLADLRATRTTAGLALHLATPLWSPA